MADIFLNFLVAVITAFALLITAARLVKYNSSVFLVHARMVENVWKLIKVTNVNAPMDLLDTTAKRNYFVFQAHVTTEVHASRQ